MLVRKDRENKLSTPFNSSPYKVLIKTGNRVVVEAEGGAQYERNVTHVKKFSSPELTSRAESLSRPEQENETVTEYAIPKQLEMAHESNPVDITQIDPPDPVSEDQTDMLNFTKPTKMRKLPEKYKEFDMS